MTQLIDLDRPSAKVVMREVNGKEVLFTADGKVLAGQVDVGHVYYQDINVDGKTERRKCFRATFMFGKEFHGGEPLEL